MNVEAASPSMLVKEGASSTLETRCVYLEGVDFPISFSELARVVVDNCKSCVSAWGASDENTKAGLQLAQLEAFDAHEDVAHAAPAQSP